MAGTILEWLKFVINLCLIQWNLFFEASFPKGVFPGSWKKANIVPFHAKESNKLLKNYSPISLTPVFATIFKRLIFKYLFHRFIINELFTNCQSGFLPGDSCISQSLSIVHEIKLSFDGSHGIDVRGVFFNISKAFNKVWH